MTFIVNGIKEKFNKKYNIEFTIGVDSPLLAKKFLENIGIIVLSFKEYKEKGHFGNISLFVKYQEQSILLETKFEGTLDQACLLFFIMGFEVEKINFINNSLKEEEVLKIVQTSKQEYLKKIEEEKKIFLQEKEIERKIFEDPRLESDKKAIEWIFEKIKKTLTLTQGFISGKELKKIREKEDELRKLKLGTNHERIVELIQEMLDMLDMMEKNYYDQNRDKEKVIFEGSVVTNVDVQKQLNLLEKIQQLKKIGGKITSYEQWYQIFGKNIIFLKFLIKDFFSLFVNQKNFISVLYNFYDLLEFILIFVLIQIPFYILLDFIFLFGNDSYDYFYLISIKLGLWGLLLYGARYLRRKNILNLTFLILLVFVFYNFIITVIKNNFLL